MTLAEHPKGPLGLLILVVLMTAAFLYSTLPASAENRCMMVWVPDKAAPAKPHHDHYERITDYDHDERAIA